MSEVLEQETIDKKIEELSDFVIETAEKPMSSMAVAALLESRGLRDVDAIEKFNCKNIFDLADIVYQQVKQRLYDDFKTTASKIQKEKLLFTLKRFFLLYGKGILFAAPMVGQLFSILYFRYSLWAWMDFSVMQASIVAIATLFSFIFTGGLAQIIGREGIFYSGQKNPYLMNKVCLKLIAFGVAIATVFSVVVFLSNIVFGFFSTQNYLIFLLYYNLLTYLWLIFSVLFMLEFNLAILLSTVFGTLIVHAVMISKWSNIYLAHACGLSVATITALLFYYWVYKKKIKQMDEKLYHSKLPRRSVLVYIVEPFMIFGTFYFSFLFVDRIVGWSAGTFKQPLPIWFRTPYELGMDWALTGLLITSAVLTYTVHQFNMRLIPIQQSIKAVDYVTFNKHFKGFFYQQMIMICVVSLMSTFFVYFGALAIKNNVNYLEVEEFFSSGITYFTFWFASFGYSFLIIAQMCALFFFSLAKTQIVIKNIAIALVANIMIGYILSRTIAYEYSVVGLFFGSLIYLLLMVRSSKKMIDKLDYQYYSAF